MSIPSFQILTVDDIELDVENPRIAKWIEYYGDNIPSEQVALALGAGSGQEESRGPSYLTLKQSIRTNKGVIHPIIVNRESNGRLVVIEGNTRAQIFREFKEQGVEGSWDKIPAMVHDNLSPSRVEAIRLQAHLVGIREWDPYSKAKYLNTLRNNEHLTFDQIVDFCGGNKREVIDNIQAYQDMEKHYRPVVDSDQEFDASRFSAFFELQKAHRIEALLKSGYTKTDFGRWVHTRKLYPLSTVRRLPQILRNDKALEIFLKDGAREAIKVLDVPEPGATLDNAALHLIARELAKRVNSIAYGEMQRLRKDADENEREYFFEARDALVSFCRDISVDL